MRLTSTKREILKALLPASLSTNALSKATGRHARSIERARVELEQEALVVRQGEGRDTAYSVTDDGRLALHPRQSDSATPGDSAIQTPGKAPPTPGKYSKDDPRHTPGTPPANGAESGRSFSSLVACKQSGNEKGTAPPAIHDPRQVVAKAPGGGDWPARSDVSLDRLRRAVERKLDEKESLAREGKGAPVTSRDALGKHFARELTVHEINGLLWLDDQAERVEREKAWRVQTESEFRARMEALRRVTAQRDPSSPQEIALRERYARLMESLGRRVEAARAKMEQEQAAHAAWLEEGAA